MAFGEPHQHHHMIAGVEAALKSSRTPKHLKTHLAQRLKENPMANWMAGAVKRPGSFSAKAKAAGESTAAYAAEKSNAPGLLGKQARLAQTFAKFRPKKKKVSSPQHAAFTGR
jgi:hypothetical protein